MKERGVKNNYKSNIGYETTDAQKELQQTNRLRTVSRKTIGVLIIWPFELKQTSCGLSNICKIYMIHKENQWLPRFGRDNSDSDKIRLILQTCLLNFIPVHADKYLHIRIIDNEIYCKDSTPSPLHDANRIKTTYEVQYWSINEL